MCLITNSSAARTTSLALAAAMSMSLASCCAGVSTKPMSRSADGTEIDNVVVAKEILSHLRGKGWVLDMTLREADEYEFANEEETLMMLRRADRFAEYGERISDPKLSQEERKRAMGELRQDLEVFRDWVEVRRKLRAKIKSPGR